MNGIKLLALGVFAVAFVGCERPIITPELPQTATKVEQNASVTDESAGSQNRKRGGGGKETYNNGPVVIVIIEDTHFKPADN